MKMRIAQILATVAVAVIFCSATVIPTNLLNARGKITMLRVHDVGTKYGPPSDQIDAEVIIKLDTHPANAYGFQLRDDNQHVTRQGMLDLLRDAFKNNWPVSIDYNITPPKVNGVIIRVWIDKS